MINSLVLHHIRHGDITPMAILPACWQDGDLRHDQSRTYDLILMGTGYKLDYPFIDAQEPTGRGGCAAVIPECIYPQHRNLFMMGMVEAAGLGWEGRNEQAEMVALCLRARLDGNPQAQSLEQRPRRSSHAIWMVV